MFVYCFISGVHFEKIFSIDMFCIIHKFFKFSYPKSFNICISTQFVTILIDIQFYRILFYSWNICIHSLFRSDSTELFSKHKMLFWPIFGSVLYKLFFEYCISCICHKNYFNREYCFTANGVQCFCLCNSCLTS
jgi:hypothetical protein